MQKIEITKRVDEIATTIAEILQAGQTHLNQLDGDDRKYIRHLLDELQSIAPHVLDSHTYVFAQSILDRLPPPKPTVEWLAEDIHNLRTDQQY